MSALDPKALENVHDALNAHEQWHTHPSTREKIITAYLAASPKGQYDPTTQPFDEPMRHVDDKVMPDLRHRLWEALRFSASRSVISSEDEKAILAVFDASPKGQVEAVAIKPLEWNTDAVGEPEDCSAMSVCGMYNAGIIDGEYSVILRHASDGGSTDTTIGWAMRSIETAKAAAQADFEARIRSALSPAPSGGWQDAVADQIIGQIEERFPNWRSYRDLIDCIDCTLHDLRASAAPSQVEG